MERGTRYVLSEELSVDVQIYQDELKKPVSSSVILIPMSEESATRNQLLLKWSNPGKELSQSEIESLSQRFFIAWQGQCPLYKIERAFIDIHPRRPIELYITFQASNIYSNTQIRNIKKNAPNLLRKELKAVYQEANVRVSAGHETTESSQLNQRMSLLQQQLSDSEQSQRRIESEWQDKLLQLQRENNDLQLRLQQSKSEELAKKDQIGRLTLELEKQQRQLDQREIRYSETNSDIEAKYKGLQEELEDLAYQYRQTTQELFEKQREIQNLQYEITSHDQLVQSLQIDFERLKEANNQQIQQLMSENETLKQDIITYQNQDLDTRRATQGIQSEILGLKNDVARLSLEKETIKDEYRLQTQRMEQENQELHTILSENQAFEEQTQSELLLTNQELNAQVEKARQLELEISRIQQEWETRQRTVQLENDNLSVSLENARQLERERQAELISLNEHIVSQEQALQMAHLEKDRLTTKWKTRIAEIEREKEELLKQTQLEKEQFVRSKELEIQRLTERLQQQQGLVEQLMKNQQESQSSWQGNYKQLEENYQKIKEQSTQFEQEVIRLRQENRLLEGQKDIAPSMFYEEEPVMSVSPIEVPVIETVAPEVVVPEITESALEIPILNPVTPEISDMYADDNDYDYYDDDYDYEYEDEYEDEYEYEDDSFLGYHKESIEDDIEEYFDDIDDDSITKISKQDYQELEEHLDSLKKRFKETPNEEAFKLVANAKMKKFKKFESKFENDVKKPKLFSRKYKMEEGLLNQAKGYALISYHLGYLLGDLDNDDDYDYDDYEDDYDYDYDYDY